MKNDNFKLDKLVHSLVSQDYESFADAMMRVGDANNDGDISRNEFMQVIHLFFGLMKKAQQMA